MKASKFSSGQKLEKIDVDILPKYLRENKNKYLNWLE